MIHARTDAGKGFGMLGPESGGNGSIRCATMSLAGPRPHRAYGMGGDAIAPLLRSAVRTLRQAGNRRAAQAVVRRLHQALKQKEGCYGALE